MNLDLVRFRSEHVPEASRVYAQCFNLPPWEEGWSLDVAAQRLEMLLAFPTAVGVVARQQGHVVGLAIGHVEPFADGSHFYLSEICVSSAHQRSGVGDALLDVLSALLREDGVLYIWLLTERALAGESFFRKQGFEDDSDSVKLWRKV